MNQIFYTLSISLFDSLSTTLQIIAFVLLLTTANPLRNAISYLAGLSGAYFICGVTGYLALDQIRVWLAPLLSSRANVSDPQYYGSELITGIIMTAAGVWYFYWKKKRGWSTKENWIISKLKSVNGWVALGIGVFISATSFPVSIPYLITLGKYASLHLDFPAVMALIALYNFGYALPMVLILVIYLAALRRVDDVHDQLHEKAKMLNLHLTAWTMAGFGLFSILDAGCFFVLGKALLADRYF
jgi:cytochrome c biogenesis protein CcdA